MTNQPQSTSTYKLRVSHSLDFSLGMNTPPKRDRGKTATKIKVHRFWDAYRERRFIEVVTDLRLIQQIQADLGPLEFEKLQDLYSAYELQSEAYRNTGVTEKAHELDLRLLDLLDKISERVSDEPDSPLGLSTLANSHTNGQQENLIENDQQNQGFQRRAKRGSKGITPYGKRAVRSCAVLMEEKFSRRNLAFITCTLPTMEKHNLDRVCTGWDEITRIFFQALTRMLARKNLSADYVQVTEIQEKRYEKWGQICPHLHFICQSRLTRYEHWRITPADIRFLWERTLSQYLGIPIDGSSATRIENPRKSLAAEMGKYLTKGGKVLRKIVESGSSALLPSAWWGASAALKTLERSKRIERCGNVPNYLLDNLERLKAAGEIWFCRVYVDYLCPNSGTRIEKCVGIVGRFLSRAALNRVLNLAALSERKSA